MERIKGLIDAPFTPFYENGEVNLEPIEAYAKMLVKNGLQGVFINGSSGEGYMLTEEERMRLAERWVSVAPEGFKVIVHVGSCCVKASRMLAEHAQKIGAWGIGAMAPPFPKIGRIEELVKYIEEIAAGAPELPFYYYHIPAFNGAFLPMVKLLEAVDGRVPNFAGIKYTFESMYEYNQCRLYKNGKFDNETFFLGTIGAMLSLSGIIFLIYCFTYEMKNKKKLYKESKILAGIGIIIGIIMITLSILYFYKNI